MKESDRKRAEKYMAKGHELRCYNDGDIDWCAMDADYHNGPECVKCGESWCDHCVARGTETIEPCRRKSQ